MAVIDRHKASGAMGLGLIQGIRLQRGALAGTIAHDHHNLVVIGADDESMMTAAAQWGRWGRPSDCRWYTSDLHAAAAGCRPDE
ncbi:MAG: adenine deaminase C-terminal domain-containing protein [Caldilineaceae bacterium]